MTRFLIVATMLAVFGLLMVTGTAVAQQERDEVMVVIPMDYMSAATAAQLFGGQVVAPSPRFGQSAYGSRGGFGSRTETGRYGGGYDRGYSSGGYQSGTNIGGGYDGFGQSGGFGY